MKNFFLIMVTLLAVACEKNTFFPDDTTTFTTNEMTVNVTPTTTSFSLVVKQKWGISHKNILFAPEKSTAIVNKHCYLPKELVVLFPNKAKEATYNVEIYPKEIKEPLTMSFYLQGSGGRIASEFIDTITVKLIPAL